MPRRINKIFPLCFVFLIILDQLVKYFVIRSSVIYSLNVGLPIISDVVVANWCYAILCLTLALLLFFIRRMLRINIDLPIAFILSGAISNLIDRISRGGVIDYLNLHFWPSFNLSDLFIVIGVIILGVKILRPSLRS